ncbi:hypothetical protein Tco_0190403, partial [Tanacetum coccineum]
VSNDNNAVAQRRLEDKQSEEKANTDCLRSTQQCMNSVVAKHLGVTGLHQQNGLVDEKNVTLFAKVLHGFEFWVEPQKIVDQGAGLQEVQTQDLIDYQLARDRDQHLACEVFGYREDNNEDAFTVDVVEKIYAHKSLTFNNTVAYEEMQCKAEIWATKGLLDKAKGNVLEGHSILLLEVSLSRYYDVEKNVNWSCIYAFGSREYLMVCTRLDISSADVDVSMLDKFDHGLQTDVTGFCGILLCGGNDHCHWVDQSLGRVYDTGMCIKKEIWLKGLLTKSGYELRLVAGIATGAMVKGCSLSEVPAQVKVASYRY